MRNRIVRLFAALAALVLVSSCIFEEKGDVVLTFSTGISYQGSGKLPTEDMKIVHDAFAAEFDATGLESMGSDHWVLRAQHNNDKARSIAQSAGDKANASLASFSSPADFDVTVRLDSPMFGDETVCKYSYKAK